jgi:hypothetical protein
VHTYGLEDGSDEKWEKGLFWTLQRGRHYKHVQKQTFSMLKVECIYMWIQGNYDFMRHISLGEGCH